MIEKIHHELFVLREQLERDSLKHGSLGMDSFVQWVHVRGQHNGITQAIEIIDRFMGERRDADV